MPDFDRVSSGQKWRPTAGQINAFVDAAAAHRANPSAKPPPVPGGNGVRAVTVWARNDTGGALPIGGVAVMGGVVTEPGVNLAEFRDRHRFKAVAPTGNAGERLLIFSNAVPAGRFARATIAGVAAVQVNVTSGAHTTAGPSSSDTAKLHSGSGAAEILFAEKAGDADPTGVQWCLVLLGGGGGGAPHPHWIGTAGDDDYDAFDPITMSTQVEDTFWLGGMAALDPIPSTVGNLAGEVKAGDALIIIPNPAAAWQPDTQYAVDDLFFATEPGSDPAEIHLYEVHTAHTSGSGSFDAGEASNAADKGRWSDETWVAVYKPGGGGGGNVVGTFVKLTEALAPATKTTFGDLTTTQKNSIIAAAGRTPDDSEEVVIPTIANPSDVVAITLIEAGGELFLLEDPTADPKPAVTNFVGAEIHESRILATAEINAKNFVIVDPCV